MQPDRLYVHIPFCARRCSYCDFAIAVRRIVPVDDYLQAIDAELALRFSGSNVPLKTLYLGGGTPSRLGGEGISRLLAQFRSRVEIPGDAEVTIEANPDDVTVSAARAWHESGINRVSLGAQSFDDRALQWMHRVHDAKSIAIAVDALRSAGFTDISLDLIFALPSELNRNWRDDLMRAIDLDPTHISLYGLTVEPHAPLGRWIARGETAEAPEENYESEFLMADELLTRAGFEHYEVSNFAKPGHRARHNSAYWQGVPYGGIGPGAHEFDPPRRRWNVREYAEWVRRLRSNEDPMEGFEDLSDENRVAESVYLGMRTVDGLTINASERSRVAPWVEAGWANLDLNGRLILTPTGWLRLDSLAADLTLFRSR
jgi:oxygen-independent coproporphyrinogen III oxidase